MLEGTIVNLRAREMDDLERNYRWVNDREVTRFIAMRYQMSLLAEEDWMRERTKRPLAFDLAAFAIETKDGRHIGNCVLRGASPENRSADLGIVIGEKDCWGRGYGADAVRTLVRFGFDEMNLERVELHVYDFNARAIASYRNCGFIEEGRLRQHEYAEGAYHDSVVMAVLRDEWEATR